MCDPSNHKFQNILPLKSHIFVLLKSQICVLLKSQIHLFDVLAIRPPRPDGQQNIDPQYHERCGKHSCVISQEVSEVLEDILEVNGVHRRRSETGGVRHSLWFFSSRATPSRWRGRLTITHRWSHCGVLTDLKYNNNNNNNNDDDDDDNNNNNKAIRDGRPRPPRHQGFIAISYGGPNFDTVRSWKL